ncbi:MAG: hypothetical protein ABSE73_09410 [Planctomycetota bacterium]
MIEQEIPRLAGRIVEHQKELQGLSSEDAQWVMQHTAEALALFVIAISNRGKKTALSILRLISAGKKILIPPTSGKEQLATATDVFTAGIDSNFKILHCDDNERETPETQVAVYEMLQAGDYTKIFRSFPQSYDEICLTRSQIKRFVQANRSWIRNQDYNVLFLFKEKDEFFVACVNLDREDKLHVQMSPFSENYVWRGGGRDRVVVPEGGQTLAMEKKEKRVSTLAMDKRELTRMAQKRFDNKERP